MTKDRDRPNLSKGQAARDEVNWQNRTLFHGDNLAFLRAMNSETVDLIATDPPFNKGKDFHATPDSLAAGAKFQDRWSWERDVHEEWADKITDDYPKLMEAIENARHAHSDGMGAYMCFMAVRLLEMHRVLKPTGSIYLHCDPTASHYLKAVMDAIFGWRNFRNEIIWQRIRSAKGSQHKSLSFGRNSDTIFYYVKGEKAFFHPFLPLDEIKAQKKFNKIDEKTGERYFDDSSHIFRPRGLGDRPNLCYEWRGFKNPTPSGWVMSKERLEEEYQKGNFVILDNGNLQRRKYEKDYLGEPIGNVWTDISPPPKKERTAYPTQKPLALLNRIIKASSNPGDIVLDPFAGCATTCVAAEKLNRQWVGVDIWEGAHELVENRLKATTGLFGKVIFTTDLPQRTDDGEEAAPFLRVKERVKEPDGPRWTRGQMYEYLINQNGPICQGCDRMFDDPRYLELDHNTPRSDGGLNHISNRILLCSPCNRLKSNTYTLSGLRGENRKRGYMA